MTSVHAPDGMSALRPGSDGRRSTAELTRPRASSASARGSGDKAAGMWFFSRTRQQLQRPSNNDALGYSYGAAAQALRQRPRPGAMAYGKVVGFEIDAPADMHAMIAASQKQNHRQPLQRGPNARITVCPAFPRAATTGHRDRVATAPAHGYVARLESQLNTCHALQLQPSPEPKSSSQRQRSTSVTAAFLPCGRRLEVGGSGRHRQPARSTSSALRVTTLTKEWVKAEEVRAVAKLADGSTGVRIVESLLPIPAQWTLPSHAGKPYAKSCVARLRESKFKPFVASSMTTRSRAASVGEETAQQATQPLWRRRLLAEPIQSYSSLKDAVVTPLKPTPSSQIPLLGSARIRRENCERRRHSFEYQRFQLQGELEDQLEWRNRCRSILLKRSNSEDNVAAVTADSPSITPLMPEAAGVNAMRVSLLTDVFGGSVVPSPQRVEATQRSSFGLRSVWCQEAARQAVQQEKRRVVALLQSFVVTCSAAALTLADTEELRAETIRRVWHPEENAGCTNTAFFYREQFLKFLRRRYQLHLSTLDGAADTMRSTDIIDVLPSQAEASFARYAYEILPNVSE
ncbi:hypothetical protein GH5_01304 [Leishmania sp. Ghana 2012 LV757]|uniref:hypothetical protein n=1 Tax=Leishmania sp. Ghana 2012 LV757 TaxID=2803181 RepID=UPI001B489CCF|nr:hypothetical protein GH5_01304 [Leishmania sp. Ghana 2012 LV757]